MLAPALGRRFDERALLRATGSASVDQLWTSIAAGPWPFTRGPQDRAHYAHVLPGDLERIESLADAAGARVVDVLGAGPAALGRPIDWHIDHVSGRRWPLDYGRRLEYAELDKPTDVKMPWEISRLQWLLPAGQSYALTGNEQRALDTRDVIDEWIDANPYALGINWACTMDVALRLLTLTWLFHAFQGSEAWSDAGWRGRLLRSLYLHGVFTERNLERSDVNGNHYTADLVGLVAAGVFFFGHGTAPERWLQSGWDELEREILLQVHPDGVDFEASSAYHRLVAELCVVGALLQHSVGRPVSEATHDRLRGMGRFVTAYTRPDGSAPNWGDSDDARALPFGGQPTNDHRYVAAAIELTLGGSAPDPGEGVGELWWLLGAAAAQSAGSLEPESSPIAFHDGGAYVLRGPRDHVFADCGPVGLAGRGGHGHNDCLSFEAHLDGVPLLVDCGAYAYTRSVKWRNRFRSTAFHNTPRIDDQEQNRLDPQLLWSLAYDAVPEVIAWSDERARPAVSAAHSGYRRLSDPVRVKRTLALDTQEHLLAVLDELWAVGEHEAAVPFHLAPGVELTEQGANHVVLAAGEARFVLAWEGDWRLEIGQGWYSPSYGVKQEIVRLEFRRDGLLVPILTALAPGDARVATDVLSRARSLLRT